MVERVFSMNKKTIMLDMDDVITISGLSNLIELFLGEKLQETDMYYKQDLLGDKKEDFFKFFVTKNLYDYVDIVDHCKEVLEKVCKYYDVYITTDYIWRDVPDYAGDNMRNKFNFLNKNFPFLDRRKYIFTSSKNVVKCDIRIDDKIENLLGDDSDKYLFTANHNKKISKDELDRLGITRVNNWLELSEILITNYEN